MVATGFARARRLATLASTLAASSCSVVLGINDAHVDPTLLAASDGSGGSASLPDAADPAAGTEEQTPDAAVTLPPAEASAPDATMTLADARVSDAPAEAGPSAICKDYCDGMESCTGNTRQYLDKAQCLKVCSLFPEGAIGAPDGNSAACRLKYAKKVFYALGTERDAYCAKAGPGSDGTCGSVCDGFCSLMMPTCTAAKTAPYFYASVDACLSVCRGLKDSPPYTVADGTLPDRNDAQCRLFHVTSAVMDSDEHCEHSMGVTMCDGKVDGGM